MAEEATEHWGIGELHVVMPLLKVEEVARVEGEVVDGAQGLGGVDGGEEGHAREAQMEGGCARKGQGLLGMQSDDVGLVDGEGGLRRDCAQADGQKSIYDEPPRVQPTMAHALQSGVEPPPTFIKCESVEEVMYDAMMEVDPVIMDTGGGTHMVMGG